MKVYLTAKKEQPLININQDSLDNNKEFKIFLIDIDAPSKYKIQNYKNKELLYAINYFIITNLEYREYSILFTNNLTNYSMAYFLQLKL